MGYPNNQCMFITIFVHHMQLDELFDFLNGRIDDAPPYWYSESDAPYSITGGYAAVTLNFESYTTLRTARSWNDPLQK